MSKHKWHKEIIHWAKGGKIEMWLTVQNKWIEVECPGWESHQEYRIKPQPKEPQYLYAFNDNLGNTFVREHTARNKSETYIGKIKLEQDDDET